jgi:hypothetical protein
VSSIVSLVKYFVPQSQVMSSQPKHVNVGSSAPNSIVFAPMHSSNQTQSRTVERLTLSFSGSESSESMDGVEKQKSTGMATFGGPEVA